MAEILSENLMETISFYDYQESYYHGFLVGMLKNIGNYIVQSNRGSGNGRPGTARCGDTTGRADAAAQGRAPARQPPRHRRTRCMSV